jgi:hypothetical protein
MCHPNAVHQIEARHPELLLEVAQTNARLARRLAAKRSLLQHAASGRTTPLERALLGEEAAEREDDRVYWSPLLTELQQLRHARC